LKVAYKNWKKHNIGWNFYEEGHFWSAEKLRPLWQEANELIAIFVTIVKETKAKGR